MLPHGEKLQHPRRGMREREERRCSSPPLPPALKRGARRNLPPLLPDDGGRRRRRRRRVRNWIELSRFHARWEEGDESETDSNIKRKNFVRSKRAGDLPRRKNITSGCFSTAFFSSVPSLWCRMSRWKGEEKEEMPQLKEGKTDFWRPGKKRGEKIRETDVLVGQ